MRYFPTSPKFLSLSSVLGTDQDEGILGGIAQD